MPNSKVISQHFVLVFRLDFSRFILFMLRERVPSSSRGIRRLALAMHREIQSTGREKRNHFILFLFLSLRFRFIAGGIFPIAAAAIYFPLPVKLKRGARDRQKCAFK